MLKAELARFPTKEEMRSEIANAMSHVVETPGARMDELSLDMQKLHDNLSRELAGHVRAAAEENRRFLAALDDR